MCYLAPGRPELIERLCAPRNRRWFLPVKSPQNPCDLAEFDINMRLGAKPAQEGLTPPGRDGNNPAPSAGLHVQAKRPFANL